MQTESAGQPLPATGGLFRLARLGWYPAAALAVAILLASIPGYLTLPPLSQFRDVLVYQPTPASVFLVRLNTVAALCAGGLSIGLAALLFLRKSGERMGLFLAYYLLAHAVVYAGPLEMVQLFWPASSWVILYVVEPLFFGPMMMTVLGTFPDGRFVPRWSRWLVPITAVLFPIAAGSEFYGPLFVPGVASVVALAAALGMAAIIVGLAVYAQVFRYRHVSTPAQRQQTKLVLYSLALFLPMFVAISPLEILATNLPPGSVAPWWVVVMAVAFSVSGVFLPISLTVAVLRNRLFDIDILIRRTLVYSALTAALAAVYFAGVTLAQAVFRVLTGQESQLAIVVSTLGIAALFQPLRRRIQDGIDRRFYRHKYDAAQALTAFSVTARDEVDLDALSAAMVALIQDTIQPAHVSLWLNSVEADRETGQRR